MDRIIDGAHALAWQSFIEVAIAGYTFDLYPDASVANYVTYALFDTDRSIDWHSLG